MFVNAGINTERRSRVSETKVVERAVPHIRVVSTARIQEYYTFGELIGKGGFGTVISAQEKSTNLIWALKVIDRLTKNNTSRSVTIEREIKILKMVSHPHIIQLKCIFETPKRFCLVLEKCTAELKRIMRKKKVFTEQEARKVISRLADAVVYLHRRHIVHRDLKLENILVTDNPDDPKDELFIKVSDFGLSVVRTGFGHTDMLHDYCGTLSYMAPEMIAAKSYSHQVDLWSMGVIMYLLLSGKFPFEADQGFAVSELICKSEPSYSGFSASDEAVHLLTKMLAKNPAMRITAAEVMHHPWIQGRSMAHTVPHNVLDMMRLWRREILTDTGKDSCLLLGKLPSLVETLPAPTVARISPTSSHPLGLMPAIPSVRSLKTTTRTRSSRSSTLKRKGTM